MTIYDLARFGSHEQSDIPIIHCTGSYASSTKLRLKPTVTGKAKRVGVVADLTLVKQDGSYDALLINNVFVVCFCSIMQSSTEKSTTSGTE